MSQEYDVVFIGAGHNGLTTAAYLAKAGLSVCLLERADFAGGAVNTREVTLPGFKHDTGSVGHVMIQSNPLLLDDELGLKSKFGLEYIYPKVGTAAVYPDGSSLFIHHSVDDTCESIAQFSQHDADAYRKFNDLAKPMGAMLSQGTFSPPVSFAALLAQLDGSEVGRNLARIMFMSAEDLVDEWFEDERVKLHLLKYSTEQMSYFDSVGSALALFFGVPMHHAHGTGTPRGGSGELAAALVRAVEAYGGEVRLSSEVVGVTVSGGKATGVTLASGETVRARRAVVSNVDPRPLFNDWVPQEATDPEFRRKVNNIKNAPFSGIMQHLALDTSPTYVAGPAVEEAYMIEPSPWLADFKQVFADLRMGRVPRNGKVPLWICNSQHDPTRAPEGKHVVYLWQYVPFRPDGREPEAWDDLKEEYADETLDFMRTYVTNLTSENILARTVHSPIDYPRMNPNLVDGSVTGPRNDLLQYFSNRPIHELGRFRTPIDSLYLVGHAMHPGGAVSGGGRAVAMTLFDDFDIDFDDVVG